MYDARHNRSRTRLLFGLGGLVLVFVVSVSLRGRAHADTEDARKAIDQVLKQQVDAWNAGKLEEFMVGYWKSDDLSFYSGNTQTKGWQATLDRYRKRYQGKDNEMGELSFSEVTIEVLSADSAYVRGRWKLVRSKDKPEGLFTLIFKKQKDGWRIIHDHTSTAS